VVVGEHLAQLVTIIIRVLEVYYNMNICIINQIRLNSKPNERPDLISSNRNSMQKFKVVLVGDQNVGKSSIIGRYIRN